MTMTTLRNYVVTEAAPFARRMLPGSQTYVQTSQNLQDVQDLSRSAGLIGTELLSLQKDATSYKQQYLADLRDIQDKFVDTYASREAMKRANDSTEVEKIRDQLMAKHGVEDRNDPNVTRDLRWHMKDVQRGFESEARNDILTMMDSKPKDFEKLVKQSEDYKIASLGKKVYDLQLATGAVTALNRTIESGIAIAGIVEDKARRKRDALKDLPAAEALLIDTDELRKEGETQLKAISAQLKGYKDESVLGLLGIALVAGATGLKMIFNRISHLHDRTQANLQKAKALQ